LDGQDNDGQDSATRTLNAYTALVRENINYNDLVFSRQRDVRLIDEFVDIIIDTLMTKGDTVRINSELKPRALVKSTLLKLKYDHVDFALNQFKNFSEPITKKKPFILTVLYNSSLEINAHYTNLVESDKWQ
jgi:hypothetical protein